MKLRRGTRANLLTNQLTSQGAESDRPENQDQCFRVEQDWEGGDWSGKVEGRILTSNLESDILLSSHQV